MLVFPADPRFEMTFVHYTHVTRSDKRGIQCQLGHSELLIPTENATEELSSSSSSSSSSW